MINNKQFDRAWLKEKLEQEESVTLTVVSESMAPIIKKGEQITIEKVELKELQVFDIILFEQAERLNCHFITQIHIASDKNESTFITNAYSSPKRSDYPLHHDQILGKVRGKALSFYHKLFFIMRRIL